MATYYNVRTRSTNDTVLTDVSTATIPPEQIGAIREEGLSGTTGGMIKKYKYVKFNSAATAGKVVCYLLASTDTGHTTVTIDKTTGTRPAGVALATMTTSSYGWIQLGGNYATVSKTSTNVASSTGHAFYVEPADINDGRCRALIYNTTAGTANIAAALLAQRYVIGYNVAVTSGAGASSTVNLCLNIPEY